MRTQRRRTTQRAGALIVATTAAALFSACNLGGSSSDDSPPPTSAPAPTARTFTMPGQASQSATAKTATNPVVTTPTVTPPKQPCQPCASQEDFDAAQRAGKTCCPAQSCVADSGCSGGRVCCKIPGGTLCTDAGRCAPGDRVKAASRTPGGACRANSDCPDGDLCCDTGAGRGKPGKCMGISDGIKGCAPPP